jgi:23S rRNA (cytosine1962-C5)-methyltransferase
MPPLMSVAVALKKDLSRALRQGHPWVFRDALGHAPRAASGDVVSVTDKNGRVLAYGYWDARSAIAVRVLDRAPVEDREALIRTRLTAALAVRRARMDLRTTTAFRWVHGEADRLPGIHVDVYGDVAAVRFDGEGSRRFYGNLARALVECGTGLALRRVVDREARGQGHDEVEVLENGLRFLVDVGRGQKGGLFLDQRDNRVALAVMAPGKTVLNLFGYTGGFSVHAAHAGAASTDTVDIARPAIATALRNF